MNKAHQQLYTSRLTRAERRKNSLTLMFAYDDKARTDAKSTDSERHRAIIPGLAAAQRAAAPLPTPPAPQPGPHPRDTTAAGRRPNTGSVSQRRRRSAGRRLTNRAVGDRWVPSGIGRFTLAVFWQMTDVTFGQQLLRHANLAFPVIFLGRVTHRPHAGSLLCVYKIIP